MNPSRIKLNKQRHLPKFFQILGHKRGKKGKQMGGLPTCNSILSKLIGRIRASFSAKGNAITSQKIWTYLDQLS
jgi:hypothetical protein